MNALADHRLIRQITDLAEAGTSLADISDLMAIPQERVRRIMRTYGIRTRPALFPSAPSAPRHKLMGGR